MWSGLKKTTIVLGNHQEKKINNLTEQNMLYLFSLFYIVAVVGVHSYRKIMLHIFYCVKFCVNSLPLLTHTQYVDHTKASS